MLSPTDHRVLALLQRVGPSSAALVGRECFARSDKPARSGTLPAAAHLARMLEQGLVTRNGRLYSAAISVPQATLFPTPSTPVPLH